MYVALGCSSFFDASAYSGQLPAKNEPMVWQIAWDNGPPLRVGFGMGEEFSISDPEVGCRVHQAGMRYTVILAVPPERFGRESLQEGDRVRLAATLADPRRGSESSWDRRLECSAPLREALTQPE